MIRKLTVLLITVMMLLSSWGCAAGDPISENINKNKPTTVENVIDSQIEKEKGNNPGNIEDKPAPVPGTNSGQSIYTKSDLDLDLTGMSDNMIYSAVSNMMNAPENYADKIVRFCGYFSTFKNDETGDMVNCCIIPDALACCANGLEFILREGEYPSEGQNITVTGIFRVYNVGGFNFCKVEEAEVIYS